MADRNVGLRVVWRIGEAQAEPVQSIEGAVALVLRRESYEMRSLADGEYDLMVMIPWPEPEGRLPTAKVLSWTDSAGETIHALVENERRRRHRLRRGV